MNQDDIIRMAREAGFDKGLDRFCPFRKLIERFAVIVATEEREQCAKLCHDKAWELKERSIKETVKTQRARLASEAAAWHDAFTAIRARGQQ